MLFLKSNHISRITFPSTARTRRNKVFKVVQAAIPTEKERQIPYVSVSANSEYEIRFYKPYPIVVTDYERRDEGFDRYDERKKY